MYIGICYTRIVEYWKFLIGPLRIHREKSVKNPLKSVRKMGCDMYMGMWYTCSVESWAQTCPAFFIAKRRCFMKQQAL